MICNEYKIKYIIHKYIFMHCGVGYCNFCAMKINDRSKI